MFFGTLFFTVICFYDVMPFYDTYKTETVCFQTIVKECANEINEIVTIKEEQLPNNCQIGRKGQD